MIPRRVGSARRLLVVGCTVVVVLAAVPVGWYATQSVGPECVVGISKITDAEGGRVGSDKELIDRAYQQAIDSGHCDPPRARWKQWLD
ncbi:hypothetical protein AB0Q95_40985 [Streptomyces sp. NPDC059900]|uniref:hypothetical protein n=1 Tax=Streptomyces sp. NPDC059900 TaxID=3155816 RepID=UPI0034347CD3